MVHYGANHQESSLINNLGSVTVVKTIRVGAMATILGCEWVLYPPRNFQMSSVWKILPSVGKKLPLYFAIQ